MQYPDLTLMVCSFNTPQHVITLLRSFVHTHSDGPFNLIVCENSTNNETRQLLEENDIRYIDNPGGTHSKSVDKLLDSCQTQYALLVDSDIVFLQPIDKILETMKANKATLLGEIQADRGGYRLYPRVAPWFCFIDVNNVKEKKITFHDQVRIDRTNSKYFYQTVPLNPHINNTNPFYDVGATFYEDINKAKLKILDAKGIRKYFSHYEGGSWRRTSGNEGYMNLGKSVYERFLNETKSLNDIKIKGKFITDIKPIVSPAASIITGETHAL